MINLSEHKNTLEKRKRKELRKELVGAARELCRCSSVSEKINGYGLVVWNEDSEAEVVWRCGNIPASLIGEYFKQTMGRTLSKGDARAILKEE